MISQAINVETFMYVPCTNYQLFPVSVSVYLAVTHSVSVYLAEDKKCKEFSQSRHFFSVCICLHKVHLDYWVRKESIILVTKTIQSIKRRPLSVRICSVMNGSPFLSNKNFLQTVN